RPGPGAAVRAARRGPHGRDAGDRVGALRRARVRGQASYVPVNTRTAITTNVIPVKRSVRIRGTKLAAARPIWCPATDITNVITPNSMGASHEEYPARARLAPAAT